MIFKTIVAVFAFLVLSTSAFPCGVIIPKAEVTAIAQEFAYKDFPKVSDILAIMRIESGFNPNAENKSVKEHSKGIMQVNGGPMEFRANVTQGVKILREYYLITKSQVGAVKAYNIGIGNYLKNKAKVSAEIYYAKFIIHRAVYDQYPRNINYLGEQLGCKKQSIRRHRVPPIAEVGLPKTL